MDSGGRVETNELMEERELVALCRLRSEVSYKMASEIVLMASEALLSVRRSGKEVRVSIYLRRELEEKESNALREGLNLSLDLR